MTFPFVRGGSARTDNSHSSSSFGMGDNQKSATEGVANREVPILSNRVVGIVKRCGQWIVEHSHGFVERDTVFSKIALGLFRIPLKLHISLAL